MSALWLEIYSGLLFSCIFCILPSCSLSSPFNILFEESRRQVEVLPKVFLYLSHKLSSLAISLQTGHTALINTQNNWRPPQGSKCKQITFHWHVFGTPKNHIWKDTLMYFLDIWKALLGHCWWMGQVVNAPSPRPKMIVSLSVSPFKGLLLIL